MCEFCENIPEIKEPLLSHPLEAETDEFPAREKLILAKCDGKMVFYGFNKYKCEDDAIYRNIDPVFCPMCGRKIGEIDMRKQIKELAEKLTKLEIKPSEKENICKGLEALSDALTQHEAENDVLKKQIEKLEEQLQNPAEPEDVICSMSPIQVAEYLIGHETHIDETTTIFGIKYPADDVRTFEISDLEQIAEHLLVYCKHNKENEE